MMISQNMIAMNAYRHMTANYNMMYKALERLSSGLKINRAADDPAGLAISEKMRAQIRGLAMAEKNSLDAISLIQTAEGALGETHEMLHRARELAVRAASDTNTEDERRAMQLEINELLDEVNAITGRTEFNTQKLLDGSFKDKKIQTGANQGQNLSISIDAMNTDSLGLSSLIVNPEDGAGGLMTQEDADKAIQMFDGALSKVSTQRAKLGATQNRLGHTVNNLATMQTNLTQAESRIRSADMAKEMMEFTKFNILAQVGQAMLAQAMQVPQGILQLLR